MKYRKQIFYTLLVAVILWGISYYIARSCMNADSLCQYEALITPFFIGMPAVFIISLILLFVRESTYLAWRNFATWFIVISAIILFIVPSDTPGGWISGGDITKETASWGLAILFLVISLIIIVKKSLSGPTATN